MLHSKTAIVTGSTSAIGLGVARSATDMTRLARIREAAAQVRGTTLSVHGAWTAQ